MPCFQYIKAPTGSRLQKDVLGVGTDPAMVKVMLGFMMDVLLMPYKYGLRLYYLIEYCIIYGNCSMTYCECINWHYNWLICLVAQVMPVTPFVNITTFILKAITRKLEFHFITVLW